MLKAVTGRRPAARQLATPHGSPQPELPHSVPKAVVPFREARRKSAQLVAVRPQVPRLGDQLRPSQHRILQERREERRSRIELAVRAGEHGSEIEAKAVHPHLPGPVAKGIEDELRHARVRHVDRVAAAGPVLVAAGVIGGQPVVRPVVDAAEGQRRAESVALGGVIEHDVQQHLDAGRVQRVDHCAELGPRRCGVVRCSRQARIGGEEAQRVVAPVVGQAELAQPRLGRGCSAPAAAIRRSRRAAAGDRSPPDARGRQTYRAEAPARRRAAGCSPSHAARRARCRASGVCGGALRVAGRATATRAFNAVLPLSRASSSRSSSGWPAW